MPFKSLGDAQKANVRGKREAERDGKPFNEGKEERRGANAIERDLSHHSEANAPVVKSSRHNGVLYVRSPLLASIIGRMSIRR